MSLDNDIQAAYSSYVQDLQKLISQKEKLVDTTIKYQFKDIVDAKISEYNFLSSVDSAALIDKNNQKLSENTKVNYVEIVTEKNPDYITRQLENDQFIRFNEERKYRKSVQFKDGKKEWRIDEKQVSTDKLFRVNLDVNKDGNYEEAYINNGNIKSYLVNDFIKAEKSSVDISQNAFSVRITDENPNYDSDLKRIKSKIQAVQDTANTHDKQTQQYDVDLNGNIIQRRNNSNFFGLFDGENAQAKGLNNSIRKLLLYSWTNINLALDLQGGNTTANGTPFLLYGRHGNWN